MKGILARRPIMILGLALIVIGLTGPTVLATIKIDTTPPTISSTWPNGTQTTPTSINSSTSYTISLTSPESGLSCWVLIDGTRLNLLGQLQEPVAGSDYDLILQQDGTYSWMCNYCGTVSERFATYAGAKQAGIAHIKTYHPDKLPTVYKADWTSPVAGTTTMFEFHAKDVAGNESTNTCYSLTGSPNGEFYINGQGPLTTTSSIIIATRTLNFELRPMVLQNMITGVRVVVASPSSTTNLSKQPSGYWTGTWTATVDGTYTINGYIDYSGGAVQVMSIFIGIGEPPTLPESQSWLTYLAYIGVVLVVVGLIIKK